MYNIWQKILFVQVGVDLNKPIPECYYQYSYTYIHGISIAMYLIQQKLYSAQNTKYNTQELWRRVT